MNASGLPNGREESVTTLERLLHYGGVVLLHGPVGAGKTTVLEAIARRARARGVPCGVAPQTHSLSDLTQALSAAYPTISTSSTQRVLRSRLRSAVEKHPCCLLLDNLGDTGAAFKGALRVLRGTGAGVLLVADTDQPRDFARVRALHLAHHEVALERLHGRTVRSVLLGLVAATPLPFELDGADLRRLAVAADGLPGRCTRFIDALKSPAAWRNGRPRYDWLRCEAVIAAAERYRKGGRMIPCGESGDVPRNRPRTSTGSFS